MSNLEPSGFKASLSRVGNLAPSKASVDDTSSSIKNQAEQSEADIDDTNPSKTNERNPYSKGSVDDIGPSVSNEAEHSKLDDGLSLAVSPSVTNPSSANNNGPPVKVRDGGAYQELCESILSPDVNVPLLLARMPNIDLNIVPQFYNHGKLLLHFAFFRSSRKTENIKSLLATGADPKAFCKNGRNALQCAVFYRYLNADILSCLTENYIGAEKRDYINSFDENGARVTNHVAKPAVQRVDIADLLLKAGADWTLKDSERRRLNAQQSARNGFTNLVTLGLGDECKWNQVDMQNTAMVQGLIWENWSSSPQTREKITEFITPNFRLDRIPEDPAGGNGRESTYLSKQLDDIEFMHIAMPYFSLESSQYIKGRKKLYLEKIKRFSSCSKRNFNSLGLQCVSTLDEYCRPNLPRKNLEQRNSDQVLDKYQTDKPQDQRIILTVPQIWIWKINGQVITALPKTIRVEFGSVRDKLCSMYCQRPEPSSKPIGNILIGILISGCVDRLRSQLQPVPRQSIFGIFERSISELSAKIREYTSSQAMGNKGIGDEKDFILKIGDIREELSMIQSVLLEQEQVWREFTAANFPELFSKERISIPEEVNGRQRGAMELLIRPEAQFAKYKLQTVKLDADAERVEGSTTILLDLKSKHDSLKEAHLTTLMSAGIIGFTFVTIVFTPLAFLASLFSLSTNKFQDNQHNSTLQNGASFYHSSYIGRWMGELMCSCRRMSLTKLITIELASLFVTGTVTWLALKFLAEFSIKKAVINHIWKSVEAWWKKSINHRLQVARQLQQLRLKARNPLPFNNQQKLSKLQHDTTENCLF